MTKRDALIEKWKVAVERGQMDVAHEYFQAALEEGAKEIDRLSPGGGDMWRDLGKIFAALQTVVNA